MKKEIICLALVFALLAALAGCGESDTTSDITANVTSEVTENVTGGATSDITRDISGDVTSEVTSNTTGDITSDITSEVTGGVTSDITSDITHNVTDDVTSEVTSDMTWDVTSDITSDPTSDITGGGDDPTPEQPTDDGAVYEISTKYGTLKYPKKWEKLVDVKVVDGRPYTVKFAYKTSAGNIPLFDLTFNGGDGYLLGSMTVNGQKATLRFADHTINRSSMSEQEYNNCCAMQENINTILAHLVEDYGFTYSSDDPTPEQPTDDGEVYEISTKYGTLKYPKKWEKLVDVKVVDGNPYTVKFAYKASVGNIPLFDLTFNGGDGYYLGSVTVNGQKATLRFADHTVDQSSMSEQDYNNCCAMQEDINEIISHLVEDYGFTYSTDDPTPEQPTDDGEVYEISTKYGTLKYPKKWEKLVDFKLVDGNPYTVKFAYKASVGNIPLFDLTFNGGDGYYLGSMTVNGQKAILRFADHTIEESSMSEQDYNNCCAMQEDINEIIAHLVVDYGFTFSTDDPTPEQPTDDGAVYEIATKYGTLKYPKKWEKLADVKVVDGSPYTVKFAYKTSAGNIPLFDLTFNGGDGYLLGSMTVNGEKAILRVADHTIDQSSMSEQDYNNCCAMQADINTILAHLIEDYGFTFSSDDPTPEQPTDDGEVYEIATKYGTLKYLKKWEKLVDVKVIDGNPYTVKFAYKAPSGNIPLFDLTFNGGDGYYLGHMSIDGKNVDIYIEDYEIDQSGMSDEEYFNCCAMCDDVNEIISHLIEDYGFSFE